YSIRVRTSDVGGLSFEKVFRISVNDLPEQPGTTPPQDLLLSSNRIDENRPVGTVVGNFSTIDPDIGDTHTYTLVAGEGSTDNNAFTIVGNQLRLNRIPDFETKPTYSIRVRTSDVGGLSFEKTFTVFVNDLRERPGDTAPTDLLLSRTTVNENVPIGSLVGTLSTVDADQDDRFTYSLVPGFGDNAAFTIVDNELRTNAPVDFETKSSYTVQITTTDVGGRSFTKTLTIGVINLDDPPIVTPSAGALSYVEQAGAVPIDGGIRVSDVDSPNLTGATVRLLDYVAGQDRLSFTPQAGITGNFDAANGLLTFSGVAPIASYQTLLRSVAYTNTSNNPTPASRTVQFSVRDATTTSNLATRSIQIRAIDSPPVVTTSAGGVSYLENAGEVIVDAGIRLSDEDSLDLTGATVRIGGHRPNQDRLSFTPQSGITGSFEADTGVLTLTGTASLASYQAALRSVTYANTSNSPNTAPRTIQFSVRDRTTESNVATRSIQITAVNTAPTVTLARGPLIYTENAAAVALDSQLTLTDPDSLNLAGATVQLVGYVAGQDSLSFTPQSGIRGGFDAKTGVLNFSGIAPIGSYQALLRSVTYRNSSDNPNVGNRTLQVSVRDAAASSNPVTRPLRVISVNDPPTLKLSRQTIAFTGGRPIVLDPQLQLSDLDHTMLSGATLTLRGFVAGEDTLLMNDQNGITSRFDPGTGVLTLTGTASVANYQTALRSVRYLNSSTTPTTTSRTVEWRVRDGVDASASVRLTLQFDATFLLPTLDLNGSGVGVDLNRTFVVSGPPVTLVASDARFTNQDYPSLSSARVVISNLLDGANEMLLVDTVGTGISAAYDAIQGVLTLSGRAPLPSYLQVLRSVRYQNRSDTPDTTTRTILFTLSDGNRTSVPAQATVQIAPINLVNGASNGGQLLETTPATDLITALDGNDTVVSILSNLQQNDIINGGGGSDTFRLLDGSGTARVEVENPMNQIGGILTGNTTITNFEIFDFSGFTGTTVMVGSAASDQLIGGRGNDQIFGKGGNDQLTGNSGNDLLDGGTGDDRMEGGTGDDLYIVDSPNDMVLEVVDAGFDTVQASVNWTLGNHLEALTLTGRARVGVGNALDNEITGNAGDNSLSGEAGDDWLSGEDGNDILNGGSGNDQLFGGSGRDTLLGGDGNDRLVGGDGRDRITGGKGQDSIVLTAARRNSLDVITDFRPIDDTLIISRSGFSPSLRLGRIARSRFVLGNRAQDRMDRFIYNRGTGVLFFDRDGAGGLGAVAIARFTNRPSLTRADIVISN
ncbi:MAG: cadherin domain-containing protein, partial [Synechococcales cyanobacterium M58_A2018_015]|nr:cadherin domain-containing protein [Synechococcales cyanobacterium M58_A2018_015]